MMTNITQQQLDKKTEQGQAMTEFLISASFFLIPLFLGMSLIAKYIDIKQTNVQAARYQAWEYTVWYANDTIRLPLSSPDGELMSGFTAANQPIKSTIETRNETKQRFYRNPGDETTTFPILDADQAAPWDTNNANPLWQNHRGMPLYTGVDGNLANLASSDDTPTIPVVGNIVNFLMDGIAMAYGLVGELLTGAGSSVGFNAINTNGYAVASESMQITTNPTFIRMAGLPANRAFSLDGSDIVTVDGNAIINNMSIVTTASVLTDAWSAGGNEHVFRQAGGTAPTTALAALLNEIPGFSTVWSVAALLAPELAPCDPAVVINSAQPHGSFWLGYLDIDAVHPDRLIPDPADPDTRNGTQSCNDAGMCDFSGLTVERPEVVDRECDRF
tara:strand:+ start:4119 stop:5282 length:1164 start_codon:yes stop_codon:yes gene_type:complete